MAKLTFNAITVICTGNICRSPLGNGCCAGCFPLPGSIQRERVAGRAHRRFTGDEIAAERGTLLEGHVARRLTPPWCATTI